MRRFILIFLLFNSIALVAQNNNETTIDGLVTDEQGNFIPLVTVEVKHSAAAKAFFVVCDSLGKFQIKNALSTGTYSFVFTGTGFESRTITGFAVKKDSPNSILISLKSQSGTLSEIVVVGYGQQHRRDVTSAISSVNGADVSQIPVSRLDQALQGKVPGLTISTNDATPGGDVSIRIRGYTTAAQQGDNSPLFIIDGVPVKQGIDFLNPNDIETINVLKDAAAGSIYGVQAANGVIVITTKRGKKGKSSFRLDTYTGVGEAWRQDIAVLSPREVAILNNEMYDVWNTRLDGTKILPGEEGYNTPNPYYANPDSLPEQGTDWQKAIFRQAILTDIAAGYQAGNDRTQFSMSGGYRKQDGVIINTDFKRYTLTSNLDHQINRFLKSGITFNYAQNERRGVYSNVDYNSITFSALGFSPLFPVRTPDGLYGAPPVGPNEYFGDAKQPVAQAELADRKFTDRGLNSSVYFDANILKGLSFRSLLGLGWYSRNNKTFDQPSIQNIQNVVDPNTSTLSTVSNESKNLNWDNYLTYTKKIKDHNIVWVLGSSAQTFSRNYSTTRQEGFDNADPSQRYFGFGDPNKITAQSTESNRSLLSYFTRINYSYRNKYLLQGVIRRDGASVFAAENRWGTFPALSVGWNISEESFFQSAKAVDNLKLRGSWGQSGNFNLGDDYLIYNRLATGSNYPFGDILVPGVRPSQFGQQNISWETNEQIDAGLDAAFLNNKFTITIDYYNKLTKNMLIRSAIPGIAGGAQAPPRNIGKVRNSGIEFAVGYNGNIGKDFKFSINANGATLRNEVIDLGTESFILPVNRVGFNLDDEITRAVVGGSISEYYGYVFDGIYQNAQEIAAGPTHDRASVVRPGDIRWKDISGPDGVPDGIISDYDRTTLGSAIPNFTYGLTLNLYYKNFDFNMLVQGSSGSKIFSLVYRNLMDQANGRNRLKDVLNHWTGEGSTNVYPRVAFDDPAGNWRVSDRYVFDGDYTRIRNMQIGYSFNVKQNSENWNLSKCRIYFGVQNLLTITKYFGFEPEVGQNANQANGNQDLQLGIDKGIYPLQRTYLLGINLSF